MINGAEEFIEAGRIMSIPTTIGFEVRTGWSKRRLKAAGSTTRTDH